METARIILRPWQEDDAEVLFKYASDPELGPLAGWPPHKSVDESREVIRTLFSKEGMWAVVWKATGEPIGCVGYLSASDSNLAIEADTAEVGYWIARPYWGIGICTEALRLIVDHCFKEKGFTTLWGCYFPDNPASGRVMEKCGFEFTGKEVLCPNLKVGAERPVKVMKLKKNTKRVTTIRRIIGITALVLWMVAFSSALLNDGERVAYQMDYWATIFALILTPIYAVLLTIRLGKGMHWTIKLAEWIVCAIIVYVCCFVVFFAITMFVPDHRTWSNKDYVVYSEFAGFFEPKDIVLYRRDGLIDRKMYCLRCEDMGQKEKVRYSIYDTLDLIKEEVVYNSYFAEDSVCRDTIFYRLSDGKLYDDTVRNSLLSLINKQ